MTNLKKWKIVDSRWVINHRWCQVRQDTVELPNGTIIDDFFVNVRPDIVLILALTPQEEIIFVRQYRHGSSQILLELPAGTFDVKKEKSMEAAQRELAEETGYHSSQWIGLGTIYENPIKDQQKIHLFIALNTMKVGEQNLDITEEIEVVLWPIQVATDKILQGEICVAGTISTIYLGLNYLSTHALISSQSVELK